MYALSKRTDLYLVGGARQGRPRPAGRPVARRSGLRHRRRPASPPASSTASDARRPQHRMMRAMNTLRTSACSPRLALLRGRAGRAGDAECVVPSKPGGAMDLTCKLAQKALQAKPGAPRAQAQLPAGRDRRGGLAHLVSQRARRAGHPGRVFRRLAAQPGAGQVRQGQRRRRALGGRARRRLRHDRGARRFAATSTLRRPGGGAQARSGKGPDRRVRHHRQPGLDEDGAAGAPGRRRPDAAALRRAGRRRRRHSPRCTPTTCRWCRATPPKPRCTPAPARCACWRCCPNSACPACWRPCRPRASRATTWSGPSSAACGWDRRRAGCRLPALGRAPSTRMQATPAFAQLRAAAGLYPFSLTGDAADRATSSRPWPTTSGRPGNSSWCAEPRTTPTSITSGDNMKLQQTLIAAAIAAAACSPAPPWPRPLPAIRPTTSKLIDGAKKEGKLVIYGATDSKATAAADQGLQRPVPGHHGRVQRHEFDRSLQPLHLRSGGRRRHRRRAVVLRDGPADQAGRRTATRCPTNRSEAAKIPGWAVWKDMAYGTTFEPAAFVYNKRLVTGAEIPQTHADFAAHHQPAESSRTRSPPTTSRNPASASCS